MYIVIFGVITPTEALQGFSNPGLVIIALLFIIVGGVYYSGGLNILAAYFFQKLKTIQIRHSHISHNQVRNTPAVEFIQTFLPVFRTVSNKLRSVTRAEATLINGISY